MKNKKVVIGITSIVAVLLVIIGVTYAYWLLTKAQTGQNLISSGCLDISLNGEKNDITLTDQFPLSDEDGMKLVPYEFTVTNNCNTSVDYQVNLESLGTESSAIIPRAIKVALNDNMKLLSSAVSVDTTVSGAYDSHAIGYSRLAPSGEDGSSDSYKLRIWIDADAPISERNKTFTSKISVTAGQGLSSPFEEGTLAYTILANNGGVAKEVDTTYTEVDTSTITASSIELLPVSIWFGTELIFNEKTGYTLGGTVVQATLDECRGGTATCGNYTFNSATENFKSSIAYEITDFKTSGNVTAKKLVLTNDFSKTGSDIETGLFKIGDTTNDSYYFRGAPTNNYVKFGTYTSDGPVKGFGSDGSAAFENYATVEECQNANSYYTKCEALYKANDSMYWRILRVNGNGSIRLIYDGTTPVENGKDHASMIDYNHFHNGIDENASTWLMEVRYTNYNSSKVTEYKSTVKNLAESWYSTNLNTNYGDNISTELFCNDISTVDYYLNDSGMYENYTFSGSLRFQNHNPSVLCNDANSKYNLNIGLISLDEAILAGIGSSNYLYTGSSFWTMTPEYQMYGANSFNIGGMYYINNTNSVGSIHSAIGYNPDGVGDIGIRPVINLRSDVTFTGKGTIDSPYEIVME